MKNKTLDSNIFDLYDQLPKNGAMRDFIKDWATELGKPSALTIKNHWIGMREIPTSVTEAQKVWAINYLQKAIKNGKR